MMPFGRQRVVWSVLWIVTRNRHASDKCRLIEHFDVASDVGVNFKNVGVLSIESSLFHLFHYTFLQTKHLRKGY